MGLEKKIYFTNYENKKYYFHHVYDLNELIIHSYYSANTFTFKLECITFPRILWEYNNFHRLPDDVVMAADKFIRTSQ